MKKLRVFIQLQCPYCKAALDELQYLLKEEAFSDIELELIDEVAEAELAASYDYYYVPSFYYQKRKLHEGAISKEEVRTLLEQVAADAK